MLTVRCKASRRLYQTSITSLFSVKNKKCTINKTKNYKNVDLTLWIYSLQKTQLKFVLPWCATASNFRICFSNKFDLIFRLQFRNLVKTYNCDLCFTPMILADSFCKSNKARNNEFTTNLSRVDKFCFQFYLNFNLQMMYHQ